MRNRLTVAAIALAAFAAAGLTVYAADAKSIGDVMKEAHDGGPMNPKNLRSKVISGKATKEEKEMLLSLYEDLAKGKPELGTAEAWKKKTDAIVKLAKEVVDGKKSEQKLGAATSC